MSSDAELLRFIAECLDTLAEYAASGRELFLATRMLQDAIIRRMEILADATGRLSDDVKERHPEIPWRAVVGFRNVVAHAYMGVALERVWEYLTMDLPALRVLVNDELHQH